MSKSKQHFINAVRGPVYPIPTPFTESGEVDYPGLESYVAFLLENSASTIMVTVGTSRFDLLTTNEQKRVNETVVKAVGGKATTIVTTPTIGPTTQAADFARHAAGCGADAILLVYPERYYGDDAVVRFFEEVSGAADIATMIHLSPIPAGKAGFGPSVQYSPALLERLAAIPNLVGMKEESRDPGLIYAYHKQFADKLCIIGGAGAMRGHIGAHALGQRAYLVGTGNFEPRLEEEFFKLLEAGKNDEARQWMFDKETEFFNTGVAIGWHVALKEAMAQKGLVGPWERAPLERVSSADRERIAEVLKRMDG